jgi:hypothetical protein
MFHFKCTQFIFGVQPVYIRLHQTIRSTAECMLSDHRRNEIKGDLQVSQITEWCKSLL